MATTRFRVLDAMPAPHGGRILRLRLQEGDPPALRSLRNATLRASGPDGDTAEADVAGFALFGGKPSAERLARSGRVDVHVTGDSAGDIGLRWNVEIA
jgi:hypothetical protein